MREVEFDEGYPEKVELEGGDLSVIKLWKTEIKNVAWHESYLFSVLTEKLFIYFK